MKIRSTQKRSVFPFAYFMRINMISLGVFDCSIHSAEESATVLHKAVKVYLVQEVTLAITHFVSVISTQGVKGDR